MKRNFQQLIYISSAGLYVLLLYFTPRNQFFQLITLFSLLFSSYFFLMYQLEKKPDFQISRNTVFYILLAGVFFRLIAWGSIPLLSDDYFRFIWDGKVWIGGQSPFLYRPVDIMAQPGLASTLGLSDSLFDSLNSPEYFTIYPPVNQWIFALSVYLFPNSTYGAVLVMKSFILLAECGSLYLMFRLLSAWKIPGYKLGWYALNPLVIVELTGNIHFEALMIVFLLMGIWYWSQKKFFLSSIGFILSVSSKLLPLMFLPLALRREGWIRSILWGSVILIGVILLFIPLLDQETLWNMGDSVGLYFQRFEFNASLYYIVRWIGYQYIGYNIIQDAGPILALAAGLLILLLSFLESEPSIRKLAQTMMWSMAIYLAFASIVHPWYSTTIIALAIFSPYRFPMIWSAWLPFTYAAYRSLDYQENITLVALGYILVYGWAIYEIWKYRQKNAA